MRLFFTRRFASERKQISLIADEKSPARISHRSFATKSLRNEDSMDNSYIEDLRKQVKKALKEDKMGEVSLAGRAAEPVRLGEKEYFLLGDNRSSSEDSRFPNIGNVKREQILGKVWFRMLPLLKLGFVS